MNLKDRSTLFIIQRFSDWGTLGTDCISVGVYPDEEVADAHCAAYQQMMIDRNIPELRFEVQPVTLYRD